MKTTSISSVTLAQAIISAHDTTHAFHSLRNMTHAVYMFIDHIGTSIALGESGDLDAAHAYRKKHAGKQ